jgi:hypothetical protein
MLLLLPHVQNRTETDLKVLGQIKAPLHHEHLIVMLILKLNRKIPLIMENLLAEEELPYHHCPLLLMIHKLLLE